MNFNQERFYTYKALSPVQRTQTTSGKQSPSWSDVQIAHACLDRPDPGRGAGWRRLCGALRYGVAAFRRREPEPGCRQGDRSPGNEVPWVHNRTERIGYEIQRKSDKQFYPFIPLVRRLVSSACFDRLYPWADLEGATISVCCTVPAKCATVAKMDWRRSYRG